MIFYRPRRIAPVDTSLVTQLRQVLAEKSALAQELAMLKQSHSYILNLLHTEHDMRISENTRLLEINARLAAELADLRKNKNKFIQTNVRLTAELEAFKTNNVRPAYLTTAFDRLEACLTCPITQNLVETPVIASDGHLYELDSISRWFQLRSGLATSPMTNLPLPDHTVIPCVVIRQILAIVREVRVLLNPQ